jgi:thiol-disulfide isomerase/thioredoxin
MRRARFLAAAIASLGFSLYGADLSGASPAAALTRLTVHEAPRPAATSVFVGADGSEHRLTDWPGKVVLVNFWATWCPPCLKEMPSIDRLAGAMEGADFEVLAISTDRGDIGKPTRWFAENGIEHLEVLHDPKMTLAREVALLGQPTTLILDRQGREIARYVGEAEWDSPEAKALIEGIIAETATGG